MTKLISKPLSEATKVIDKFDQWTVANVIKQQFKAPDLDSIQPKNNLERAVKSVMEIAQTPVVLKHTKHGTEEQVNVASVRALEFLLERSVGSFNPYAIPRDESPREQLQRLARSGNVDAIKTLYALENQHMLSPEVAEEKRRELLEKIKNL